MLSTLRYVRELTGGQPIFALLGGMHLVHASTKRIDTTIRELRQLKVQRLAPVHCTGAAATAALWTAFPKRMDNGHVGSTFSLPRTEPVPPFDNTRGHPSTHDEDQYHALPHTSTVSVRIRILFGPALLILAQSMGWSLKRPVEALRWPRIRSIWS